MVDYDNVKQWVVLIVDDERDNINVAEKILKFSGAQVYTAANGQQGLELLKTIVPGFILLDLSMPLMDGWEMFKQVRGAAATQHIPIIALTAHAMLGDQERALQAGFDGYITKPFRLVNFVNDIKQWLRKLPPRDGSASAAPQSVTDPS
jgi:CheY-like chemotaxis protein